MADSGAALSERAERRFGPALLAPGLWPTWLGIALVSLFACLPLGLRERLLRSLAGLTAKRYRKRRRIVLANLSACFPELGEAEREQRLVEFFHHYLRAALDLPLLWWGSRARVARRVRIEGGEHLDAAQREGRVILLTCHATAVEFAASRLTQDQPMLGFYKRLRNPVIDWLTFSARTRFGARMAERGDSLRLLLREIRGGRLLYYLPDEDLGEKDALFAPFFGVPKATITTLGRLAKLCDARVVPCMGYYDADRGQYVARFLPALADYPSGDESVDVRRCNEALEEMIRLAPDQYMWQMRLFRTRPAGEPAFYD